jgi:hypothetical protein
MVEVYDQIPRVYYTYGYGKAIGYSLPLTVLPGPATVITVPQYSQLTMNKIVLINPNVTNITVQILDGDTVLFATSVPAGGQIVIDNPLNFFTAFVINPSGQVITYGHGTLYLPPSF